MRLPLVLVLASCGESPARPPDAPMAPIDTIGEPDAASDAPVPPHALVLLLHGVGSTGDAEAAAWHASVAPANVVVLAPDSPNARWNASLACCDPTNTSPDEATLVQLATDRIAQGDIDPARVYVMGHSNGGFMAWRLLCDRADLFRAGVILDGAASSANDPPCAPSRPLRMLHVHGDADNTISYARTGLHYSVMPDAYPPTIGPLGSSDQESTAASCTATLRSSGKIASGIVERAGPGTAAGDVDGFTHAAGACVGAADLWRSNGGGHSPTLSDAWFSGVLAWVESHR